MHWWKHVEKEREKKTDRKTIRFFAIFLTPKKISNSFFAGYSAADYGLFMRIYSKSRSDICYFPALLSRGRLPVVAENSANIRLMKNKSKPWFLVCFRHFWEQLDLMKWKLSLASVAPCNLYFYYCNDLRSLVCRFISGRATEYRICLTFSFGVYKKQKTQYGCNTGLWTHLKIRRVCAKKSKAHSTLYLKGKHTWRHFKIKLNGLYDLLFAW